MVQKTLKTPLRNIKMAPYETINEIMLHTSLSLVAMSTYLVCAHNCAATVVQILVYIPILVVIHT